MANDSERIVYVFEDYRLDAARRMLYRGETELALAPKAVETLLALLKRSNEIVSKEELIETIWAGAAVEESNLQHYLHVLRKTLGARRDGKPYIETFRRRGYRFSADVRISEKTFEPKAPGAEFPENSTVDYYRDAEPSAGKTGRRTAFGNYRGLALSAAVFAGIVGLTVFLYVRFQTPKSGAARTRAEISVTTLTNGNPVSDVTISDDGRYFVYSEIDEGVSHLWLQQTGQSVRREVIPPAERLISGKTFSPGGDFIYFMSVEKGETESALFRVPTLGGAITKILTNINSPVSFSPDGREMVFSRYREDAKAFTLVIADSEGGGERVLLTRSGTDRLSSGNPWSPDGRAIAFQAIDTTTPSGKGSCTISSIELRTGKIKPLSAEKWDTCYRMVWTRDGDGVVFVGTREGESLTVRRDQVYYLDAETGESRRITTDGNRYQALSLGITEENSIIAVPHSLLSQIWVMNADGDARYAVPLTGGLADGRHGIAPLPDGRVGFTSRNGDNVSLWTMDADGTDQKQIFNEFPFVFNLRATPDGRYFIFASRRGDYTHLYRLNTDGTNLLQMTDGESQQTDATVSPDSRWVFYGSSAIAGEVWGSSIQKISIDGGAPLRLTTDEAKSVIPHASPDGNFISDITADDKIIIRNAADGTLVKTLEPVKNSILDDGARWLPGGNAVIYPVYKNGVVNLWLQPLSNEKARPLTDFASGEIFFYAFSCDGAKLFLARGYQSRNALLIKNFK